MTAYIVKYLGLRSRRYGLYIWIILSKTYQTTSEEKSSQLNVNLTISRVDYNQMKTGKARNIIENETIVKLNRFVKSWVEADKTCWLNWSQPIELSWESRNSNVMKSLWSEDVNTTSRMTWVYSIWSIIEAVE